MKTLTLISLIAIILVSCGPSVEEIKQREQFIADSIKTVANRKQAVQDSIKLEEQRHKEFAEQQRIHYEKIEVGKSTERTKLNKYLEQLKSRINTAKSQLNKINEFQIGRSSSTKQRQLNEQQTKINELLSFKESIEKEIAQTHLHKNHDFQQTPSGTVEHLIESAKKRDFSDVRDLVDPYGQFDDDVFNLCLVSMYPDADKEAWAKEFENGRIMREEVNEDSAEIEFAHGAGSDKLETVKLVNRQGFWYLKSF
jgi:hypothetical protein